MQSGCRGPCQTERPSSDALQLVARVLRRVPNQYEMSNSHALTRLNGLLRRVRDSFNDHGHCWLKLLTGAKWVKCPVLAVSKWSVWAQNRIHCSVKNRTSDHLFPNHHSVPDQARRGRQPRKVQVVLSDPPAGAVLQLPSARAGRQVTAVSVDLANLFPSSGPDSKV